MNAIENAKVLLNADDSKNALLIALYETARDDFLNYCNRDEVPPEAQGVLQNMLILAYNRLGSEGLASQGYSGVSESYIDGYPDNIKQQLNKYRKIKSL